jgi:hypothetical protein
MSQAEKITNRVTRGLGTLKEFKDQFIDKVIIEEHSLRDWARRLLVRLPDDLDDLDELQRCSRKVANSIQQTEYLLGLFEFEAKAITNYSDSQFAIKYVNEMEDGDNKKLGSDKLKQLVLVNKDLDDSIATGQTAALIRDFFKRILKGLEETRKSIDHQIVILRIKSWISKDEDE